MFFHCRDIINTSTNKIPLLCRGGSRIFSNVPGPRNGGGGRVGMGKGEGWEWGRGKGGNGGGGRVTKVRVRVSEEFEALLVMVIGLSGV